MERREEVALRCKPERRPCGSHRSWLERNPPDLTELQLQTEGNLAGGGRNAVSGASQKSEWEVQGLWRKLKTKFVNVQEGLERSCNFPSCVIFSRNCSDEICKHLYCMLGLLPSHSLFHNAAGSFSMPDSGLALPCLPTQRAIALIKSSSLSPRSLLLSRSLWRPILEG